jgi:IS605 OrfB family transposase
MLIRKAYKFRLKPTKEQSQKIALYMGHCRKIWNFMYYKNMDRLRNGHKIMWYYEMSFWLTLLKQTEEMSFLKESPRVILDQKLMDLEKAFKDAFDKKQPLKRLPKNKKLIHDSDNTFRYTERCRLNDKLVYIPKVGWVKIFKSRKVEGIIKNITVSREGKYWNVAIQTEFEKAIPVHSSMSNIGIDAGIVNFATLSDGTVYKPLNCFKKHQKQLARAQRKLSKKKKGSNRRKKQIARIGKIHKRIANARKDYLHKISNEISNNHAIIFIEDLKITNMSKSAKGTLDNPGRNVKAKSGLNRSILDQGWGEFRRQLEYKSVWKGGALVAVSPKNTSRCCPQCKNTTADNRRSQAEFICTICDYSNNADLVAAVNINEAGHVLSARGALA